MTFPLYFFPCKPLHRNEDRQREITHKDLPSSGCLHGHTSHLHPRLFLWATSEDPTRMGDAWACRRLHTLCSHRDEPLNFTWDAWTLRGSLIYCTTMPIPVHALYVIHFMILLWNSTSFLRSKFLWLCQGKLIYLLCPYNTPFLLMWW